MSEHRIRCEVTNTTRLSLFQKYNLFLENHILKFFTLLSKRTQIIITNLNPILFSSSNLQIKVYFIPLSLLWIFFNLHIRVKVNIYLETVLLSVSKSFKERNCFLKMFFSELFVMFFIILRNTQNIISKTGSVLFSNNCLQIKLTSYAILLIFFQARSN